jgi:hypothetical protein
MYAIQWYDGREWRTYAEYRTIPELYEDRDNAFAAIHATKAKRWRAVEIVPINISGF